MTWLAITLPNVAGCETDRRKSLPGRITKFHGAGLSEVRGPKRTQRSKRKNGLRNWPALPFGYRLLQRSSAPTYWNIELKSMRELRNSIRCPFTRSYDACKLEIIVVIDRCRASRISTCEIFLCAGCAFAFRRARKVFDVWRETSFWNGNEESRIQRATIRV